MEPAGSSSSSSEPSVPPCHVSSSLFQKRKKLLTEKLAFAKTEDNMWERSKPVVAQKLVNEANMKQSRRTCNEITKLYHRNVSGLQSFETRLKAASELIRTGTETVAMAKMSSEANNSSTEALTARFQALKIRSENEFEAVQQKRQKVEEKALDKLQNGLTRLLQRTNLEEKVSRLRKMRDHREHLLKMEIEKLLNHVTELKANLSMLESVNLDLQQQSEDVHVALKVICSVEIENLDEAIAGQNVLQQQLDACTQECEEAQVELSRLEEEDAKVAEADIGLEEEIAALKAELETLTAREDDDPELMEMHYKDIQESLQTEMNGKIRVLQDEIKQAEMESSCAENEYASLAALLGSEQHDWQQEIQDAITVRKELEDATAAERKASAALCGKEMEINVEWNRLEMEISAVRANNSAEMIHHDNEINGLQKYIEKLAAQEKEETKRYQTARGCSALIGTPGTVSRIQRLRSNKPIEPSSSPFSQKGFNNPVPMAEYEGVRCDFKDGAAYRSAASRPHWLNAIWDTTNMATVESGAEDNTRKFGDELPMGWEGTGKFPSDIQINRMGQAEDDIIQAEAHLRDYYPLPPPAFGSPLSSVEGISPDISADSEASGSELNQSVWTDFSSIVK